MTDKRLRSKTDTSVAFRARRFVADRGPRPMLETARASFGSCENVARWYLLGDIIRRCAYVLGAARARNLVRQPAAWHRRSLSHVGGRCYDSSSTGESPLMSARYAVGALRLCCLCVPAAFIMQTINSGIGPSGAAPPWGGRGEEGILWAAALDEALRERGGHV